jgi:hypothetical protein
VDLEFARAVVARLAPAGRERFGLREILALLEREPDLARLNAGQRRNEGYERSLAVDAASRDAASRAAASGAPAADAGGPSAARTSAGSNAREIADR